jgi:hypothetical protein
MRFIWPDCSARDAAGHAAAEPAIPWMKSRRLIPPSRPETATARLSLTMDRGNGRVILEDRTALAQLGQGEGAGQEGAQLS